MLSSDGRRIKRHLLIKPSCIRFLKESEIDNLKKIQLIAAYIEQRNSEINNFNSANNIDKSIPINGRNLTNFGLFRKYITQYLLNYPAINKDMILLCRQLQPTQYGIPLEIYAFSHDQKFENYEFIIADIFDHIIASVGYFDLEIFELASNMSDLDN
jgi:miniconductance mechanosensitive channel